MNVSAAATFAEGIVSSAQRIMDNDHQEESKEEIKTEAGEKGTIHSFLNFQSHYKVQYDCEKDILMTEAMFKKQIKMEQQKGALNFLKQLRKKLLSKNTNKKMLIPCWKIGQEYQVKLYLRAPIIKGEMPDCDIITSSEDIKSTPCKIKL